MFITGFAGVAMSQALEHSRNLLSKPFHLKDLVDQVNQILDSGRDEIAEGPRP